MVVAEFKVCSRFLPRLAKEGVRVDIRTGHLPNTSEKRYRLRRLAQPEVQDKYVAFCWDR